jgi:hypothetical protein
MTRTALVGRDADGTSRSRSGQRLAIGTWLDDLRSGSGGELNGDRTE